MKWSVWFTLEGKLEILLETWGCNLLRAEGAIVMKYISTLHSIITLGSSYIFRNNYNTYLQFHIVYCRDVIQHKVQVTTDIAYSTSQLHMILLV